MLRHESSLRVRYADTDQMRYAYYGVYFAYFEQGRSDLLRSIGMPYPVLEAMGFILPVIEAHAEYKRPAHYDDLLHIVTMLRDRPVARVRLDYEVYNEERNELVAEGYTIHSFVHASTGKPTRAPVAFLEIIDGATPGRNAKG
ncbi:MAG: putative thioesterase [Bacteroidetes bacterium]|nr:putative thioesterase [Bacteroidota bacterium]